VLAKQKQVIESFVRVQAFLGANPAPAPATYAAPAEVLDEAVQGHVASTARRASPDFHPRWGR
jgi:hypothetical protein